LEFGCTFSKLLQLAEDSLLADKAALTAADAATVRLVGIRRRLVEQQIKYAARMKVACVKGLEFTRAGRMFEVQQLGVEGLMEDEIKVMKVNSERDKSRFGLECMENRLFKQN
jgi:hypothetical protein